ncbi:hypothetical protein ABH975_004362 [Bradyrhizobium ottawaense]
MKTAFICRITLETLSKRWFQENSRSASRPSTWPVGHGVEHLWRGDRRRRSAEGRVEVAIDRRRVDAQLHALDVGERRQILRREHRAHAGDAPAKPDRSGFLRQHVEQFDGRRMPHEFRHRRRRAHDVGRVDRGDVRHARAELGGLDEAHVERSGLQLLHHRGLVAELAGMEHGQGQAAVGCGLEIVAEFERGLIPGMAVRRDQAEAEFLGLGERQRRCEHRCGGTGGEKAAACKRHGRASF